MTEHNEGKKKKKERWAADKLEAFFELWEEHIGSLRGARKNSHVYQDIAADLATLNFSVSPDEVKIRIKNFTATYKKEKNKVGPSGGSPSKWTYYARVHQILGSFPLHNHVTEDSIIEDIEMLEDDQHQTESSSSELGVSESSPGPSVSSGFSFSGPSASSRSSVQEPSGSSSLQSVPVGSPADAAKKKKSNLSQYELLKRLDVIQCSIDEQFDYCKQQDEKLLEIEKRRTDMFEELKDALIRHLNNL